MGTNFYFYPPNCDACNRDDETGTLHIGKSSAGWCFSLHVMPDLGINNLEDWKKLWEERPRWTIKDEYGRTATRAQMLLAITGRNRPDPVPADFDYAGNYAEPGPNNRIRHKVTETNHCVGHGDGTWDLLEGDFG